LSGKGCSEVTMEEEKKLPEPKQLKTFFVGDAELPIHFVNAVNVRAGLEEFYFTLGTATPFEVSDLKELEDIEAINAHTLFRFAVTRTVMKQIIDLMQSAYDVQTQQINLLQAFQEKEHEDDNDNAIS
jgi:hypothetical protein